MKPYRGRGGIAGVVRCSALDGDEGSTACLSSLCLGKQPFVPTEYEALWAQSQYGRFGEWKNVLLVPGIKPWIVQHIPQLLY